MTLVRRRGKTEGTGFLDVAECEGRAGEAAHTSATSRRRKRARVWSRRARAVRGARLEAATIRDIAQRAGVAPGSVFTTFESKADLLQEIIYSKYASFYPTLAALARKQGTVEDRLVEMGEKAYAVEFNELRLVAETMGASWTWNAESEKQNRERLGMVLAHKVEIVTQGVNKGRIGRRYRCKARRRCAVFLLSAQFPPGFVRGLGR